MVIGRPMVNGGYVSQNLSPWIPSAGGSREARSEAKRAGLGWYGVPNKSPWTMFQGTVIAGGLDRALGLVGSAGVVGQG